MTTPQAHPGILDKLLLIFKIATIAATKIPIADVQAGATLALSLEEIAQTAIQAHEQITGQPFDASKIPAIDPIP